MNKPTSDEINEARAHYAPPERKEQLRSIVREQFGTVGLAHLDVLLASAGYRGRLTAGTEVVEQDAFLTECEVIAGEARERAEKATLGPWSQPLEDEPGAIASAARPHVSLLGLDYDGMAIVQSHDDAVFIANARTDIPLLSARVLSLVKLARDRTEQLAQLVKAAENTDKPSLIKCANCRTNMWDCYELCPNCMDDQTDSVTEEETDEPAA